MIRCHGCYWCLASRSCFTWATGCCGCPTMGQDLPVLFAQAPLTGMFYAVYGAGDGLFAVFFFYAAYLVLRGARRV